MKRLPVDEVKIDRSFIKELETQGDDEVIVSSTVNLGHALELKVVAEGVEEASSWNTLRRLGCDLIQGYFIAKPMPISEFTSWSLARNASAALPPCAPASATRVAPEPADAAAAERPAAVGAVR